MSVASPGGAGRLMRAALAVGAGTSLGLALLWTFTGDDGRAPVGAGLAMPSLLGVASDGAEPVRAAPPLASAEPRSIAQLEEALFSTGSLRGTDLPPWGTARGEPFTPNRTLRDRFDYYLLALGEASLAELTALVQAHATQDFDAATAVQVLDVWSRYLQQHAFRHVANPLDPPSMEAALQEHRQVRQATLGLHWAQAFYGEEERALAQLLAQAGSGQPTRSDPERALYQPPPGTDPPQLHQARVAAFGADAADRLGALDAEEARWAQRLAAVRSEVEALRRDPALSTPQRDDAIARALASAYPEPTERLRAAGLLGL